MRKRFTFGLRRRVAVLAVGLAAPLALALAPGTAGAQEDSEDSFAPVSEATVHPGVMTYTNGGQCTANFVFSNGEDVFLGQSAHCAGTGTPAQTGGCNTPSHPLGTPVEIRGASQPGTLVYSSWIAMQAAGETDPNACAFNDFALVRLDPADVARTNPTMPFWGGPTGLDPDGALAGERVFTYGNSALRGGIGLLSPKTGNAVSRGGDGWSTVVFTVTPGIPGDSGSGLLSADGTASGTLSTVGLLPVPASNGVGDLASELEYANSHSDLGPVRLVPGTEPFSPIL